MRYFQFLAILLLFVCYQSLSQSIDEYYFPADPDNTATLYMTNDNGSPSGMKREILYYKKSNPYELMDTKLLNKNPMSVSMMVLEGDNEELKLSKLIKASFRKEVESYDPPITILKLPKENEEVRWTYTYKSGDKHECIVEWTTVKVNGQTLKAIKMIDKSPLGFGIEIKYYARGIGLCKVDHMSLSGNISPIYKFERLEASTE